MKRKVCADPQRFDEMLSRLADPRLLAVLAKDYREMHDMAYQQVRGGAGGVPISQSDPTGELATPYLDNEGPPVPMVAERIRDALSEAEGLIRGAIHEVHLEARRALNRARQASQPELATQKVTRWTEAAAHQADQDHRSLHDGLTEREHWPRRRSG